MTTHSSFPDLSVMNKLANEASELGYEIVDLAGFLDMVSQQATAQSDALKGLSDASGQVRVANGSVQKATVQLRASVDATHESVETSVKMVKGMEKKTREVASWVQSLAKRTDEISDALKGVKKSNGKIATIALQVNTLAINAKIEAARAGDMGRGFAVVAEAINELSIQTKTAAQSITGNVETLNSWMSALSDETKLVCDKASYVLQTADDTDKALAKMQETVVQTKDNTQQITEQSAAVQRATEAFVPSFKSMETAVSTTNDNVAQAHRRIEKLVDTSESIVQGTTALGGTTQDGRFITYVKEAAKRLSTALDEAVAAGKISDSALFTRQYQPIPNTDPEQVMAPFTELFDQVLPPIQEPALDFDPKVVFCAAVDHNGYLPTHNRKFSQAQSSDPVWNTANCRNRRIFDDRVGLKAGRSTEPFLLQVYRRDMGGGTFVMMKDLSAPIFVGGKHWGGLRFAYKF